MSRTVVTVHLTASQLADAKAVAGDVPVSTLLAQLAERGSRPGQRVVVGLALRAIDAAARISVSLDDTVVTSIRAIAGRASLAEYIRALVAARIGERVAPGGTPGRTPGPVVPPPRHGHPTPPVTVVLPPRRHVRTHGNLAP